VVACSCKEKDVVVDCLFWWILPRWCDTFCETIIFYQASTNDKILHHEGVWQYPVKDIWHCQPCRLVCLVHSLAHRPCRLSNLQSRHNISCNQRIKQAAALKVATVQSSDTKIANAASTYYFTVLSLHMHSLVREKMWWWLALARKKMWW